MLKNVTQLPAAEVAAEIGQPLPFSIEVGSSEPQVLIMHTHTTESYRTGEELWCDPDYPFRSTDNSQNMVAVGAEIAAVLNDAGIATLQDTTQHDYPSYNGSYDRSKVTVERYLEQYPSIKVVLDIHRDAIQRENGSPVSAVATGRRKAGRAGDDHLRGGRRHDGNAELQAEPAVCRGAAGPAGDLVPRFLPGRCSLTTATITSSSPPAAC